MAACPASSLGEDSFFPVASSFCTPMSPRCVRAMFWWATLVRNVLLTRASWRGRMAIAVSVAKTQISRDKEQTNTNPKSDRSSERQQRLHHLVHRGDHAGRALEGALL